MEASVAQSFSAEYHFDVMEGAMTGFTKWNGKFMPALVSPPDMRYVELFARVDGGEIKRVAYWQDPFTPHLFVVYHDWLLKPGTVVELIMQFFESTPPGKYPGKWPRDNA